MKLALLMIVWDWSVSWKGELIILHELWTAPRPEFQWSFAAIQKVNFSTILCLQIQSCNNASWVRGAPSGTKFNRTKSDWFDEGTFEYFFNDILLPRIKKQEGAYAMIGDNLSSHIGESVVRKRERHNVKLSSYAFYQILRILHSP